MKISLITLNRKRQDEIEGEQLQTRGRSVELPEGRDLSEYTVIYIGEESLTLTSLMFEYSKCKVLPNFVFTGHDSDVEKKGCNAPHPTSH